MFSENSKLVQLIQLVADIIFMNLWYLLCCLPIVTIGTATTALYAGWRAWGKKESWFKAFRKSFKSDFKRTFLAWLILLPLIGLLSLNLASVIYYEPSNYLFSLIFSIVALAICLLLSTVIFPFYARFECTLKQLFQNGLMLILMHPLRSVAAMALTWAPLLIFVLLPMTFVQLLMVWLFVYFSAAASICSWIWKKPYRALEEQEAEKEAVRPSETE